MDGLTCGSIHVNTAGGSVTQAFVRQTAVWFREEVGGLTAGGKMT